MKSSSDGPFFEEIPANIDAGFFYCPYIPLAVYTPPAGFHNGVVIFQDSIPEKEPDLVSLIDEVFPR